jgi:hypothetical protein
MVCYCARKNFKSFTTSKSLALESSEVSQGFKMFRLDALQREDALEDKNRKL